MRNLLKYYIKKRIYIVGILSIITIVLAFIFLGSRYIIEWESNGILHLHPTNNPIEFYVTIGSILATIIPMFEFSFKMKKIGIDHFYSFPIKREKLFFIKFIVGFLEVIIPFIIGTIFSYFSMIINGHIFKLQYYFIFILLSIPFLFSIYSMVSLIFSKCNTIADGIIMVGLLIFVFAPIMSLVNEIINSLTSYGEISPYSVSLLTIYTPYIYISDRIVLMMNGNIDATIETIYIIIAILFLIFGIASVFILVYTSKKEKSEDSMDLSSSWFSYKVFIPILITAFIGISSEISLVVFLMLLGYIGYVIYRRSFKIKWYDWVSIGASVSTGLIINFFSDAEDILFLSSLIGY